MNVVFEMHSRLQALATIPKDRHAMFFKTKPGHYAEHDRFFGVSVPSVRTLAKEFQDTSLQDLQTIIESAFNEERLLALLILVHQYQKADIQQKEVLYHFYLRNIKQVNNWNLVDASAHVIVGAYLHEKDKNILVDLAQSKNLWKRRIAIVATWYFIRQGDCKWTYNIAQLLMHDIHDLIHKAVGWMLREAGKRDPIPLLKFLKQYVHIMPRTMLRYAIEKFPEDQRKQYLKQKNIV